MKPHSTPPRFLDGLNGIDDQWIQVNELVDVNLRKAAPTKMGLRSAVQVRHGGGRKVDLGRRIEPQEGVLFDVHQQNWGRFRLHPRSRC